MKNRHPLQGHNEMKMNYGNYHKIRYLQLLTRKCYVTFLPNKNNYIN